VNDDRINQIPIEIGHVFQEQTTVLRVGTTMHLWPADVQHHRKRRERIRELCSELAELKGFVRMMREGASSPGATCAGFGYRARWVKAA
jgi:hypothetical protein